MTHLLFTSTRYRDGSSAANRPPASLTDRPLDVSDEEGDEGDAEEKKPPDQSGGGFALPQRASGASELAATISTSSRTGNHTSRPGFSACWCQSAENSTLCAEASASVLESPATCLRSGGRRANLQVRVKRVLLVEPVLLKSSLWRAAALRAHQEPPPCPRV